MTMTTTMLPRQRLLALCAAQLAQQAQEAALRALIARLRQDTSQEAAS